MTSNRCFPFFILGLVALSTSSTTHSALVAAEGDLFTSPDGVVPEDEQTRMTSAFMETNPGPPGAPETSFSQPYGNIVTQTEMNKIDEQARQIAGSHGINTISTQRDVLPSKMANTGPTATSKGANSLHSVSRVDINAKTTTTLALPSTHPVSPTKTTHAAKETPSSTSSGAAKATHDKDKRKASDEESKHKVAKAKDHKTNKQKAKHTKQARVEKAHKDGKTVKSAKMHFGPFVDEFVKQCDLLSKAKIVTQLCSILSHGVKIKKLLQRAATLFSKDTQISKITSNSALFTSKVSLAGAEISMKGTMNLVQSTGLLALTGSSKGLVEILPSIDLSALAVLVSVNVKAKSFVLATASGSVTATIGSAKSEPANLDFSWGGEEGVVAESILLMPGFTPFPPLQIHAGSITLKYSNGEMKGLFNAMADLQPVAGGQNLPLQVSAELRHEQNATEIAFASILRTGQRQVPKRKALLDSKESSRSVHFTAKCTSAIGGVIPGIHFLSVGDLEFHMHYKSGHGVHHFGPPMLVGSVCLGQVADCQTGNATSHNVLGRVYLQYDVAAGGFLIYAKISKLDILKAITIFGDAEVAKQIPGVITSAAMQPLQDDCDPRDIDSCYFALTFSMKPVDADALGPGGMLVQPGLTLIGSITIFGQESLVKIRIPVSAHAGSKDAAGNELTKADVAKMRVLVPGSNQPAKFRLDFSKINGGLKALKHQKLGHIPAKKEGSDNIDEEDEEIALVSMLGAEKSSMSPLFSVGQSLSGKLDYEINFVEGVEFAAYALTFQVPVLKTPLQQALQSMDHPLGTLNSFLKKWSFKVDIYNGLAKNDKYFGMSGSSNGHVKVMVLAMQKSQGFLGMASVNTFYFGEFMKSMNGGINPLKKVKLLSNINAVVTASSAEVQLPVDLRMPSPFQDVTSFPAANLCVDAVVNRPHSCRDDVICAIATKGLGKATLSMKGCIKAAQTQFKIGLGGVVLKKDVVEIKKLGIAYNMVASPPSVSVVADGSLNVKMGNWVEFFGNIEVKEKAQSCGTLTFRSVGLVPNAFGINRLNMFDLLLAGKVEVTHAGLLHVNNITVSGGICIGGVEDCTKLAQEASLELIEGGLAEDIKAPLSLPASNFLKVEQLQSKSSLGKAVVAKLNVRFEAKSGTAYFYAELSKVSFSSVAVAMLGQSIETALPPWLATVSINGNTAESAYVTYAASRNKIPTNTLPLGVKIKPGTFALSARARIFETHMGIQMQAGIDAFEMVLEGPALKLLKNRVVISRSRKKRAVSPVITLKASGTESRFQGFCSGFVQFGKLFSGQVQIGITRDMLKFSGALKIFGSQMKGNITAEMMIAPLTVSQVSVDVDISHVSNPLKTMAKRLLTPMVKLNAAIHTSAKNLTKTFLKHKKRLSHAQKKLGDADSKCKSKIQDVIAYKTKCDLELDETNFLEVTTHPSRGLVFTAQDDSKTSLRDVLKVADDSKKPLRDVLKVAKQAADLTPINAGTKTKLEKSPSVQPLCKQGMNAAVKSMMKMCTSKTAAFAAMHSAQRVVQATQEAFDSVNTITVEAIREISEATDFLSKFSLSHVRFAGGFLTSKVPLKVALNSESSVKEYEFDIDFKSVGKHPKELAAKINDEIFAPFADKSTKVMRSFKRRIAKLQVVINKPGAKHESNLNE